MGVFFAKCTSSARLDGKTAIITGCNTGIGKETAKDFFKRGAKVIMACRNLEKANATAQDIQIECAQCQNLGQLKVTELDLTSFQSIRKCAQHILETEPKIDLLINNAGIMMCPYSKTKDGHEIQFGTNHLGHFLFTSLLLPKICENTSARIVNVSSKGHTMGTIDFEDLNWEKRSYSPLKAYGQSKLANVLFTRELAKRLKDNNISGVNVYSLHPGVIKTELGRHLDDTYFRGVHLMFSIMFHFFYRTPEQGAQTQIYCAVAEECANETGLYYSNCKVEQPSAAARNDKDAEKLWEESLKLVQLEEDPLARKPKML